MNALKDKFQVVIIKNPFDPYKDLENLVVDLVPGMTILDYIKSVHGPDFTYFERPTLCLVNGVPYSHKEWGTREIAPSDIISISTLAGIETIYIVYAIIVIVVAVTTYMLMGVPKLPGSLQEADSVYNFSGQKNRIRVNEPIEIHYGKNRIFPSYAADIYTQYQDNDQYNYSLYCIGQGHYQIHSVKLEDTDLEDFEDSEYEVIAPGEEVTLFPDNVITSVEIGNIQLYAPNEPEYDGWVGPFTVNPPLTLCRRIEFDITWPGGLYESDEGKLTENDVDFELSYREIDEDGDPVGSWVDDAKNFESKTNTPQRKTYKFTVDPGRYEVRARRTDNKHNDSSFSEQTNWEACRAFLPNTKDYGNVTLIAMIVRANNNVNNNTQTRMNVIATRKLREWTTEDGWSDLEPSRSIAWAFADVFRNANYGCNLDDEFIDLEALEQLHSDYAADDWHFDFSFENSLTVWEVARTIARAGRAIPMPVGSRIGMIRDVPHVLANSVFGPENIVKDSFKLDYKHFQPDETDSVIMVYTDPDTYLDEEVTCVFPGTDPLNSERITFAGCKNRKHAYNEGMYILANRLKVRDSISFRTGLEGHIPQYGDRIMVGHDMPQVGLGAGFVLGMTEAYPPVLDAFGDPVLDAFGDPILSFTSVWELDLSEPIEFSASPEDHVMILRTKNGSADGPFIVDAIYNDGFSARLGILPSASNYDMDSKNEPPIFLFGTADKISLDCKVIEINPADDDTVEVICTNYNPDIFLYDGIEPPPLGDPDRPPKTPDRPEVKTITVSFSPNKDGYIIVGWSPALGASRYILQYSYNNFDWIDAVKTTYTNFVLTVNPGIIYLRVAGINKDRGPWLTWDGEVGMPKILPGYPDNLVTTAVDSTTKKFTWNGSPHATVYRIQVQPIGAASPIVDKEIYELEYTITKAEYLAAGALHKDFAFRVYGVNALGSSQFNLTIVVTSSPNWYP